MSPKATPPPVPGTGTPRFPPAGDQDGFQSFNEEIYDAMLRRCRVHPYIPVVKSLAENIYGEDLRATWPDSEVYETAVHIAELPGWKSRLAKAGLDDERPLVAVFNTGLIQKIGKALPKDGDLVELHSSDNSQRDFYRVTGQNPTDYFANLDRTYSWTVIINRHRFEAVTREDTDRHPPDPLYRD